MGYIFWIKRALKIFTSVLIILFIVELFKQHTIEDSIIFATTWSFLTTMVFISTRLYNSRKGIQCLLCKDTPSSKDKHD